jgi:RNA polymerase sigma factor (sigma-70 family)
MKTTILAIDRLARTARRSQFGATSDAELLRRFGADRDADAFASLVDRHGPMVLGLCKRLTRDDHLAEDAFQATFLTLSRKASAIRQPNSLPAWLFGVARRAALKARAGRHRDKPLSSAEVPSTKCDPLDRMSARELLETLDTEMARLPLAHRSAVLLCIVEGKSIEEAARQLGATPGSVRGWLQRGRNRLRDSLARRGLALPAVLGATALLPRATIAGPLVEMAVRIGTSADPISPSIAALTTASVSFSVKLAGIALLAVGLAGIGVSLMSAVAQPLDGKPPAVKPVDSTPDQDPRPPKVRLDHFGDPLPEEALARFGTVRLRQGGFTRVIRYSPDEKTIAIGGYYRRSLGLWDSATGKELFQFDDGKGGSPATFGIAFSPDGKILAAARRRNAPNVQLWNTQTGQLIRELKGHTASPLSVVFSSDGKTVISCGDDSTIRFWDVATGRETAKLDIHSGQVYPLALSSDGKLLAAGSTDKIIRVWDVETRRLLKELRGQQEFAKLLSFSLSFSPDGKQLVSAGPGEPCVIWDLARAEPAYQLDGEHKSVATAVFSPNGKWLAAGCKDGAICLYDPSTGKEVRRWETQCTYFGNLIFSKDNKTIAGSCDLECVRFWDVETGKETRSPDVHQSTPVELQLSHDGKSLWSKGDRDRRVIRWNAETAEPGEMVPIPSNGSFWNREGPSPGGVLSPGGAFLARFSVSDKTIHLLDLKTRRDACEPLQLETEVTSVQFSLDCKVLAVGCKAGIFYIWNWQIERNPKPLKCPESDEIRPWLITPDGKHLVTGSGRPDMLRVSDLLRVWDVATGREVLSFPGNKTTGAMAVSPDGKWAVSASYNGRIKVIDFEKGKIEREIRVDPEGGAALAFSPDGRILAVGEALTQEERGSSKVKLIEFATGETIATFHGHHSSVAVFQFAPDGRTLYSGGGDSTILKWDATARHGNGKSTPNPAAAWDALAQEASKAYPAHWDLVDAPKEAVALLRKKIVPAKKLDAKEVRGMMENLDSDNFQERNKASALLKSHGYSAEPFLRQMVEAEKRPEVKQRLRTLIDELSGASFLRIQRAMQVLESIGNDDAKQLLRELAHGAPESMLTKEAAIVLKRMDK